MLVSLSRQMRADNIRFYKRGSGGTWGELGENETKQKIGHALRDTRDRIIFSVGTNHGQIPPPPAGSNIDDFLREAQKSKTQLLTGPPKNRFPFMNSMMEGCPEITAVHAFAAALQDTNQRSVSDALRRGGEHSDDAAFHGGERLCPLERSFEEAMEYNFLHRAIEGDTDIVLAVQHDASSEESDLKRHSPGNVSSEPQRSFHEITGELGNVDMVGKIESIEHFEDINYIVEEVYNDFRNDSGDTNDGVFGGSPPDS
jgi:hypothetical protein